MELLIHTKSSILQKMEDEQAKSLVKRVIAFIAGGLWMAYGFKMMVSKATIQDQVKGIKQQKDAAAKNSRRKQIK